MIERRRRVPHHADDGGFVSLWVLAVLPVVIALFLVGLALWSGYAVRQHLSQLAEAAARSGANAIDEAAFNETGEVRLEEELAKQLAAETLAVQPDRDRLTGGSISVVDDRVVVVVTGQVGLLGLGIVEIEVDATAEPRLADADADGSTADPTTGADPTGGVTPVGSVPSGGP